MKCNAKRKRLRNLIWYNLFLNGILLEFNGNCKKRKWDKYTISCSLFCVPKNFGIQIFGIMIEIFIIMYESYKTKTWMVQNTKSFLLGVKEMNSNFEEFWEENWYMHHFFSFRDTINIGGFKALYLSLIRTQYIKGYLI